MRLERIVLLAMCVGALAGVARAADAIRQAVVATGGGLSRTPDSGLHGTVGQPVIGGRVVGKDELRGGFWPGVGIAGGASGVDEPVPGLPVRFVLHPNHPNPFNPTTTIRYELPRPVDDLDIRVFDVRGRLVTTLHSGPAPAGAAEVRWRGADRRGRSVSTGTYFCVMTAPDFHAVRKMMIIR